MFSQDNQSAIHLKKNGRASPGQISRHIHIRHFWITDRIRDSALHVVYCRTESMLADFSTKPRQGSLFRLLGDILLGHEHISALFPDTASSPFPEERVGDQDKKMSQSRGTWADLLKTTRSRRDLDQCKHGM